MGIYHIRKQKKNKIYVLLILVSLGISFSSIIGFSGLTLNDNLLRTKVVEINGAKPSAETKNNTMKFEKKFTCAWEKHGSYYYSTDHTAGMTITILGDDSQATVDASNGGAGSETMLVEITNLATKQQSTQALTTSIDVIVNNPTEVALRVLINWTYTYTYCKSYSGSWCYQEGVTSKSGSFSTDYLIINVKPPTEFRLSQSFGSSDFSISYNDPNYEAYGIRMRNKHLSEISYIEHLTLKIDIHLMVRKL